MATETDSKLKYVPFDAREDPIEIKPSTELIADEYTHNENAKALVHIFKGKYEDVSVIIKTLVDCKYIINEKHIHPINTKKQVLKKLKEIANQNHENKTCFLLIFLGSVKEGKGDKDACLKPDDEKDLKNYIYIKEIWSHFIHCQSLKTKPKIFLFQVTTKINQIDCDSVPKKSDPKYDIPVEADLLIIFKRINDPDEDPTEFILSLCKNIRNRGNRDDILDIITNSMVSISRPLIISTLTRKFYITDSQTKLRGHLYEIQNNQTDFSKTVDEINAKLDKIKHELTKSKKPQDLVINVQPEDDNFNDEEIESAQVMFGSCPSFLDVPMSPTVNAAKVAARRRSTSTSAAPLPPMRSRTGSNTSNSKKIPWR